jgi:hypothetical protein
LPRKRSLGKFQPVSRSEGAEKGVLNGIMPWRSYTGLIRL